MNKQSQVDENQLRLKNLISKLEHLGKIMAEKDKELAMVRKALQANRHGR